MLVSPEKTMNYIGQKNRMILIDDTFNANPDGVYTMMQYLKSLNKKKIVVLTPLIELGSQAKEIHQKIGRLAKSNIDLLILTNTNHQYDILKGIGNEKNNKLKIASN